jgi:hypothetical protein
MEWVAAPDPKPARQAPGAKHRANAGSSPPPADGESSRIEAHATLRMTLFEFHWPWFGLLLPLPLMLPCSGASGPATPREEQLEGQRVTLLHPHLESCAPPIRRGVRARSSPAGCIGCCCCCSGPGWCWR